MIAKTKEEIEGLQEIGRICAFTLHEMGKQLRPGISTKELDDFGAEILKSHGAVSAPISVYNFPGQTCISVNEVVAHGIPSADKIIQAGDLVNIDVSASKNGYFGDTGYTWLLEPNKVIHRKLCECSQRALERALAAAKAGFPLANIGLEVEKEAKRSGFKTIRNLCGHGVGLTLHDDPEMIYNYYEKKDKRILVPGMVLAIETFVSEQEDYVLEDPVDNWTLRTPKHTFSAQYEHSIVVTEDEPIILTKYCGDI